MTDVNLIIFDLDDCGIVTHPVIRNKLLKLGIDVGDNYITKENGGQEFLDILAEGRFMLETKFREFFIPTVSMLLRAGFSIGICTHRGYHERGERYTLKALAKHRSMFDYIHVINPYDHPDKIAYLDTLHGPDTYILVDDKPKFYSDGTCGSNVLLFTQPWNEHYNHEHRISSFDRQHFLENLLPMLGGESELLTNF
jgi:hypothetical protein